jgi:hypothetical protein
MPCERLDMGDGSFAIVCTRGRGRRPKPCVVCRRDGVKLCDGKVAKPSGGTRTCDRALCALHAVSGGAGVDYCPECAAKREAEAPSLFAPLADDVIGAIGYDVPAPRYLTLVVGAETLVERPGGEDWSRQLVECFVDHAETVVTTDAPGPGTWALEIARRRRERCAVYALDGSIRDADGAVIGRWAKPSEVPSPGDSHWKGWGIARNSAAVRAVGTRARQGRPAVVEALHDPLGGAVDTLVTVGFARTAKLEAHVSMFPVDPS